MRRNHFAGHTKPEVTLYPGRDGARKRPASPGGRCYSSDAYQFGLCSRIILRARFTARERQCKCY